MDDLREQIADLSNECEEAHATIARLEDDLVKASINLRSTAIRALDAEAFIDGEVTASRFVKQVRRLAQRAIWWASDMWHASEFEQIKRQRDQAIINAVSMEEAYKNFQRLYYAGQRVLIDAENEKLRQRIDQLEYQIDAFTQSE